MAIHDLTFPSTNGRDQIRAWLITPTAERTVGVVQVAHGFGEHFRRYWPLVGRLVEAGYAVAGDDHVGHGVTAENNDSWGSSGEDGMEAMVEDEHRLRELVQSMLPDLPYAVFGHSWGSMIMREYVARHGAGLTAAVFCGVAEDIQSFDEAAELIAQSLQDNGTEHPSTALYPMLANLSKIVGEPENPLAWVSDSAAVQMDYAVDPFNLGLRQPTEGFCNGFRVLYESTTSPEWAGRLPKDLPVLVTSGDQDPVGNMGAGVRRVAQRIADAGLDVDLEIWPGIRHEPHNQPGEVREKFFALVIAFYNKAFGAGS